VRFINGLANDGAITNDERTRLINMLNKLPARENSNYITANELSVLRDRKLEVANELVKLKVKVKVNKEETAPTSAGQLLHLAGLQQIIWSGQAMPITRGQDIGRIDDAAPLMEWLKYVKCARFDSSHLDSASAEKLFKQIADERSAAIRGGNRALKNAEIFTITSEKNAGLAAQYGIRVHIAAQDQAEFDKHSDIIRETQAGVVIYNGAMADVVLKAGVSEVVADYKGYNEEDGSLNLLYVATDANAKDIKDIFTKFFETLKSKSGGRAIETPEGRFNAGENMGAKIGVPLLSLADTDIDKFGLGSPSGYLSGLAAVTNKLKSALEDKKPDITKINGELKAIQDYLKTWPKPQYNLPMLKEKSDKALSMLTIAVSAINSAKANDAGRRLDAYEVYGMLSAFMGTVLIGRLAGNGIVRENLTDYKTQVKLIAQAYIAGVTEKQMSEGLDVISESSPKAQDLRTFIKNDIETARNVSAEIETHFKIPLSGEQFEPDWLALAVKITLIAMKAELNQPKVELQRATDANAEAFAAFLRAG